MAEQGLVVKLPFRGFERVQSCVFNSATFEFRVQGEKFFVHRGLLSPQSKPLNRLINIDLLEKRQGFAVLSGVSVATFERFLQWLYTGGYSSPEPIKTTYDLNGETFDELDFNCVLRAHMEIYVFANDKDIQELKETALKKLYEARKVWLSNEDHIVANPEDLIVYAYENTIKSDGPKLEPLRAFVMAYMSAMDPMTMIDDDFLEMMRGGRDELVRDILKVFIQMRPSEGLAYLKYSIEQQGTGQ